MDTEPRTLIFLVLVAAMLLIGLWASLSRGHLDNLVAIGRPVVGNLFLKVGFRAGRGSSVQDGYLRTLGVAQATFMTRAEAPAKGEEVTLELGGLPNFPAGDATTKARVLRVDALGPGSKLVTVHFIDQPSQSSLAQYVASLARTGRYSPA